VAGVLKAPEVLALIEEVRRHREDAT